MHKHFSGTKSRTVFSTSDENGLRQLLECLPLSAT